MQGVQEQRHHREGVDLVPAARRANQPVAKAVARARPIPPDHQVHLRMIARRPGMSWKTGRCR